MSISFVALLVLLGTVVVHSSPESIFLASLQSLQTERSLKGIQVQVTKDGSPIFNANLGQKNEAGQSIDNQTMFRVASLSKSFASVAVMQLVEQKKLSLTQSINELLGFKVVNPFFPEAIVTLEMVMSHQSSIYQCQPQYSNFLNATYTAKSGLEIPDLKQLLVEGGKYFNDGQFSHQFPPGSMFHYSNLNFGIVGTIVERISQVRYDLYQQQYILNPLSASLPQAATFNPAHITHAQDLGVIYIGEKGRWVPNYDNYKSSTIAQRNLTGYVIGTNGMIYGPQGALRASVSFLSKYAMMLANYGLTNEGHRVLSAESVAQMVTWRYQYNGQGCGGFIDYHTYGLGLYETTYFSNDRVISHKRVRGHTGAAYGLISAQYYWDNYTLTYIINGALNGYKYGTGTIYEYERLAIHLAADQFTSKFDTEHFAEHKTLSSD